MNPENPSREEIEAKLTALLLGELPAEEAQLLRWAISQDAALAQLHDRLKLTVGFVREVAANPAEATPVQTAPLKLSEERREKLLAHFKTIAPKEFVPLVPPLEKRREISPLLAMAAAVALIAVLAAMLLPALAKSKNKSVRAMAMNEARQQEMKARLAADDAITTAPSATPHKLPDGSAQQQTVASLEARLQNGNPANYTGDSLQTPPPVEIVLPPTQNSLAVMPAQNGELAAASPAQSDFFNSGSMDGASPGGNANNFNYGVAGVNSDRDQNVNTVHLNNADPYQAAQVLQQNFGGTQQRNNSQSSADVLTTRASQIFSTTGGGTTSGFGGGTSFGDGTSSGAQQASELAARQLQTSAQNNLAWDDNVQDSSAQKSAAAGNNGGGGSGGAGGFASLFGGGAGGGRGGGGFQQSLDGGGAARAATPITPLPSASAPALASTASGSGGVELGISESDRGTRLPGIIARESLADAGGVNGGGGGHGFSVMGPTGNDGDGWQTAPPAGASASESPAMPVQYALANDVASTLNSLDNKTLSGQVATGDTVAQNQIVGESRFYRTLAPGAAAAAKVPMLGDVPEMGRLMQQERFDDNFAGTPADRTTSVGGEMVSTYWRGVFQQSQERSYCKSGWRRKFGRLVQIWNRRVDVKQQLELGIF